MKDISKDGNISKKKGAGGARPGSGRKPKPKGEQRPIYLPFPIMPALGAIGINADNLNDFAVLLILKELLKHDLPKKYKKQIAVLHSEYKETNE
jgi:hypothetical protein